MSECEELITIVKTVDICEARSRIPKELQGKGLSWFSMFDVWTYIAEGPIDENCPKCMELDAQDFQGSYLRAMFPDLVILDEDTIYPNVHMTLWGKPTCKCILRRTNEPYDALDLYTDDDLKPYKKEK